MDESIFTIKRVVAGVVGVVCSAFASSAFAARGIGNVGLLPNCTDGTYTADAFIVLIFNVIKFLWGVTGTVALIMLIVGGFTLLLASGDPQKVKSGIGTIRNAIIGILIVLGSWIIINTLVGIITTGTIPTSAVALFGSNWSETVIPCY